MAQKLLVADDSATIRKAVEIAFANEDIDIVTVGTGAEVLPKLVGEQAHVALIDVGLPDTDGYAICQMIKADASASGTPVILMASKQVPYDTAKGDAAGADANIPKPFETQALIDKVLELSGNDAHAATAMPASFAAGGTIAPAAAAAPAAIPTAAPASLPPVPAAAVPPPASLPPVPAAAVPPPASLAPVPAAAVPPAPPSAP
ncbi:response regulator, partial [Myxococcota bacterium]|nr:response regulator [Myxococcota bacterium]